jgi:hypothetical protein
LADSLQELRALSTDELIARYDRLAPSTMEGLAFLRDEINRRDQDVVTQEMLRLTREMHRMTQVTTAATVIALVVAVGSLIIALFGFG